MSTAVDLIDDVEAEIIMRSLPSRSHVRPRIKRKYIINKPTFDQLKPLEEFFKLDYEDMQKRSKRTWSLHGVSSSRPYLFIQIDKIPGRERISFKGKKYVMYQFDITIHNKATQKSASFGKMESLNAAIDNTIKLLTFQVIG